MPSWSCAFGVTPAELAVGLEGARWHGVLGGHRLWRDGGSRRQRLRRPLGFPDGCAAKDLQPEPLAGPVLQREGGSSPRLPGPRSSPPSAGSATGTAAGAPTSPGGGTRTPLPRAPPTTYTGEPPLTPPALTRGIRSQFGHPWAQGNSRSSPSQGSPVPAATHLCSGPARDAPLGWGWEQGGGPVP